MKKINVVSLIPFSGMIFIIVLFEILTKGLLLLPANLPSLVNSCFLVMLCGLGAVFVFARGGMDFSLGGIQGMCIVMSALLLGADMKNIPLALVVCVAIGMGIGFINGITQAVLKVPAFIATLSMSYILRGAIQTIQRGGNASFPSQWASYYSIPACFFLLVLITAFCYFLFDYTRVGKVCKLIGENANAVRFTGINPVPFVIFGHVLLGLFVGIGSFMVSPRFSIVPSTAGAGLELDVMIACMIGGLPLTGGMDSKVSRPIIGSIIIGVLNQGYALLNAPSSVIQVTKGILFIVIIIITTPGALDTINSFAGRERRPNVIKENA